jgi:hypothetical protein
MLEGPLQQLTDARLDALPRVKELGELNFKEAADKIRVIRSIALSFARQNEAQLPASMISQTASQLEQLIPLIQQMESFTLNQDNSASQHQSLNTQIESLREWFATYVRPHIQGEVIETGAKIAEADDLLTKARESELEADGLLTRVRRLAGEAGAGQLSSYYAQQAEAHSKRAKGFLVAAIVGVLFTTGLAVGLFATVKVDLRAQGSTQWAELVRSIVARIFFLGLTTYGVTFLVRNYRINMHLQVVNEQKRNALDTYGLFAEAATSAEARDIISAELVKAVFASAETGFLGDGQDRTIVEGQTGLVSLLLSGKRAA